MHVYSRTPPCGHSWIADLYEQKRIPKQSAQFLSYFKHPWIPDPHYSILRTKFSPTKLVFTYTSVRNITNSGWDKIRSSLFNSLKLALWYPPSLLWLSVHTDGVHRGDKHRVLQVPDYHPYFFRHLLLQPFLCWSLFLKSEFIQDVTNNRGTLHNSHSQSVSTVFWLLL